MLPCCDTVAYCRKFCNRFNPKILLLLLYLSKNSPHHCFLRWLGSQSILPAFRLRAALLCGETHRHGDDEVHPGDATFPLLRVSTPRLHCWKHSPDQQPLPAAGGGGWRPYDGAVHSTKAFKEQPRKSIMSHCCTVLWYCCCIYLLFVTTLWNLM